MKTNREKLIELFNKFTFRFTQEEYYSGKATNERGLEQLADYLISKRVTIPVRCGECKYHSESECFHFCHKQGVHIPDDSEYYCSYGERKEE